MTEERELTYERISINFELDRCPEYVNSPVFLHLVCTSTTSKCNLGLTPINISDYFLGRGRISLSFCTQLTKLVCLFFRLFVCLFVYHHIWSSEFQNNPQGAVETICDDIKIKFEEQQK